MFVSSEIILKVVFTIRNLFGTEMNGKGKTFIVFCTEMFKSLSTSLITILVSVPKGTSWVTGGLIQVPHANLQ